MAWLVDNAWLAAATPLALAVVLWLVGRYAGKVFAWVAMIGPLAVLLTGVSAVGDILGAHGEEAHVVAPYVGRVLSMDSVEWLSQGSASASMGFALDGLTAVMLLVVGTVALMVMLFSVGYMSDDRDYNRYFTLLSLFTASMTGLVLADNLIGVFLAWELVGVCSYLLIGFWYEKPSASAAAIKAFLVTRVGDVGFLLGLAVLWRATGQLGLMDVVAAIPDLPQATVTAAAGLLFMGAAGKSAQFPLHVWLPDAMEGPTPVSALIHAATMVAAGVFLVARVWPLFEAAPAILTLILTLGVITALGAATIAVTQRDIKKVLAYSTISQLGFMFAALGAGAWRVAMFHLVTHAAFKALLFLASGSVIHGSGTQDMYEMGGLRKAMPITTATWIVGVLALAGIPPLAGFFSKDEIVASVLHGSPVAAVMLVAASALTAAYAARATRMTFFDDTRGDGHAHESGAAMAIPLVVLAGCAAVLGLAGHPITELLGGEAEEIDLAVAAVSVAVALGGGMLGWMAARGADGGDVRAEEALGPLWRTWRAGYGWDAAVMGAFVRPTIAFAEAVYQAIDRLVVDGLAVEGTGGLSKRTGTWLARLQYGDLQWYVALIGGGVIVLLAIASLVSAEGVSWPWAR
jgi:NADH-quinone oxidoreductase subunit L